MTRCRVKRDPRADVGMTAFVLGVVDQGKLARTTRAMQKGAGGDQRFGALNRAICAEIRRRVIIDESTLFEESDRRRIFILNFG
jgi:hypothetical protein